MRQRHLRLVQVQLKNLTKTSSILFAIYKLKTLKVLVLSLLLSTFSLLFAGPAFAATSTLTPQLTGWQRSTEAYNPAATEPGFAVNLPAGLALPLDPNQVVFDNGTDTPPANKNPDPNIHWASWYQYSSSYDMHHFQVKFTLPASFNPANVDKVKLVSPNYPGDIFPINDNAYIYFNGHQAANLGSHWGGNQNSPAIETDGWNGSGDFGSSPAQYLQPGDNTIDIVTEETAGWGGMGEVILVLDLNTPADSIPPVTTAILSGTQGQPNWFNGNVQVTLDVQDNPGGSGVDHTYYKINAGANQQYNAPFTVSGDGNYKVDFYSVDKAGNTEAVKSTTFNIDATAPEAKIVINQTSHSLEVVGVDQNPTTVQKTDNTATKEKNDSIYTITDSAGNTLKMVISAGETGEEHEDEDENEDEHEDEDGRGDEHKDKNTDVLQVVSLQYGSGPVITLPENSFSVKFDGRKDNLTVDQENFQIERQVKVNVKYDQKKDRSTVSVKKYKQKETKAVKDGLVLLQVNTAAGALQYSY